MLDWAQGVQHRNYRIRRKPDTRGMREATAIVLSLVAVATVFLFYSWIRNQMINLGYAEQALQLEEKKLLDTDVQLVVELQTLTNPDRIDKVAAELGMVRAQPWQVIPARPRVTAPGGGSVLAMAAGSSRVTSESKKYSATN